MASVTEDKYLGDVISSDGKNTKNISKRISKGIGIITQIIHLLEMVSLGDHFMEIALLFREALFLNGILTNSEIWYGLSKSEIDEFEDLDRQLLRKILQVPVSTPQEAYYLEMGIIPIRVVIMARRIIYLHYLVTRKETEMLAQFFRTQWNQPSKGDWTETVKKDLDKFGIVEDFEYIKSKSKESFKKMVKVKAKEYALTILTEKQQTHSKMENIYYSEIKPQKYFSLENAKIEEVRNIFRYRVRMAPFWGNYKGNKEYEVCPLCQNHADIQSLSFDCEYLKQKVEINCDMSDILTDNVTLDTARTVTEMLRAREDMLKAN